jgi:hypothetical protein
VTCNLGDLPATIADAGIGAPAIIVIGEVVRLRDRLSWQRLTAAGDGVCTTAFLTTSDPTSL